MLKLLVHARVVPQRAMCGAWRAHNTISDLAGISGRNEIDWETSPLGYQRIDRTRAVCGSDMVLRVESGAKIYDFLVRLNIIRGRSSELSHKLLPSHVAFEIKIILCLWGCTSHSTIRGDLNGLATCACLWPQLQLSGIYIQRL